MNKIKNTSARKIWWRQFKTMVRELLRLVQKYSKSINERQNTVNQNNSQKSRIYKINNEKVEDYGDKILERLTGGLNKATGVNHDYSVLTGSQLKTKRKQENYEDPWVQSNREDYDFVNDLFGFEKPKKKGKRRKNDDYGFNMEDVFDL